jgi:hypothetical protein
MMGLDLNVVNALTGGKLGTHDVPCPLCGPLKRKPISQRKQVLRIWHSEPAFASFHCARCGEKGYVRDTTAVSLDPAAIARAKAEVAERDRVLGVERLSKAKWLWAKRRSIYGSLAETYLREARGYQGAIPSTLAFLPARGEYGPAMIAAFGIPEEPEPGHITIADDAVRGVHLTRLAPDGSGKAGTDKDKIMIGMSAGWPIVLAAPNDLLGLAVTEGIENALSVHEATGLGAWAAGSASRLPALAPALPTYIEAVKIIMDDDVDGRRHAHELAARLSDRNIEVRLVLLRAPTGRRVA